MCARAGTRAEERPPRPPSGGSRRWSARRSRGSLPRVCATARSKPIPPPSSSAPAEDALSFIRDLFSEAFVAPRKAKDERLWIRGTVTAIHNRGALRHSENLAQHSKVRVYRLDAGLLDAIAVEKSGFKGMRIVVEEKLLTQAVRDHFGVRAGSRTLVPFKSLTNSVYPRRIANVYEDFLWMARSEEAEWRKLERSMSDRLRWSAQDSEEFVQAASTQVVFNETVAIFRSLETPRRRKRGAAANV